MSGKGSTQRPYSVPKKQFDEQWEKIFGSKNKKDDNFKK